MTRITESVEIKAPADRVWKVVHEDVANAPKWSSHLRRVELVDGEPPAKGSRLRYHLDLPGGLKETLEVEQTAFDPPRKAAGKFVGGPLKGTWSYTYRASRDGATRLTYDMDYQLTGLLRFAGGLLAGQYVEAIKRSMSSLKKYVESGKGPGGAPAATKAPARSGGAAAKKAPARPRASTR